MFEVDPVVAAMMTRNLMDRMNGGRQQNVAAEWKAHAEELQNQLALTQAQLTGALALVNAFKQVHPNSPLLKPSEVVYKRGESAGQPKRQSALIWEAAFDAAAKRVGFANPAALRED